MHITDKEGIKTLETSLLRSREVLHCSYVVSFNCLYFSACGLKNERVNSNRVHFNS